MTPAAVARLRREDDAEAHRFLAQRPYENVLLDWLIEHDRSSATRSRMFLCRSTSGEITGAAHFGRQVILAAEDNEAIGGLAKAAYAYRHERMIVANREVARDYWEAIKNWHTPPRLVRDRQPLLVVGKQILKLVPREGVETRLARSEELDIVMENSAAMIEYELGYDPRRTSSGFRWNVRRMIDRGMWWIAIVEGWPSFFCHIGPYSSQTVQLQGVWTAPPARGRGIAKAALSKICAALLEEYPTVSLYVNDFNTAALALYRSLGFRQSGELCTYLF
ncbi:MAG: GNAT family N-acetyltransferase [Candidatus Baltobacteraceae bacterium]